MSVNWSSSTSKSLVSVSPAAGSSVVEPVPTLAPVVAVDQVTAGISACTSLAGVGGSPVRTMLAPVPNVEPYFGYGAPQTSNAATSTSAGSSGIATCGTKTGSATPSGSSTVVPMSAIVRL